MRSKRLAVDDGKAEFAGRNTGGKGGQLAKRQKANNTGYFIISSPSIIESSAKMTRFQQMFTVAETAFVIIVVYCSDIFYYVLFDIFELEVPTKVTDQQTS